MVNPVALSSVSRATCDASWQSDASTCSRIRPVAPLSASATVKSGWRTGVTLRHHLTDPTRSTARFAPRFSGARAATRGDGADEESVPWAARLYLNVTGFPFPLSPFVERRTIRTEAVKGSIWLFEQEQGLGFSSVTTNIRMTVIKLKGGGLWVHSPIAPTRECLALLRELDAPVDYIILPTFAYEHKIFVAPFARQFPSARVWTAPSQWSWPLNLPPQLFGIFPEGTLENDDETTPWAPEISQKLLLSPEVGIGPYVEVAFFHRPSKTLVVTDCVVLVPKTPLPIIREESLLDAAQNGLAVRVLSAGQEISTERVEDSPQARATGWQRMVLQILYFGPSDLLNPSASFSKVADRIIVSPVIRTLVFNKVPQTVRVWVDSISSEWNFQRIIPAHFAAPIKARPADFRAAFDFLDGLVGGSEVKPQGFGGVFRNLFAPKGSRARDLEGTNADMKTLDGLNNILVKVGAVKKTDALLDD